MKKIKIWYRYKHEDFNVAEIIVGDDCVKSVSIIKNNGGIWYGGAFIPWHSISYIEAVDR